MNFFMLEPQVDGHFGKNCIFIDKNARPPIIEKLHFEFDSFSGDDLITSIGIYVVTKNLADHLKKVEPPITGISFDSVEISKSDEYHWNEKEGSSNAPKELPEFQWLKIDGVLGESDFAKPKGYGLVVSERALNVMKSLNLEKCSVSEYQAVE